MRKFLGGIADWILEAWLRIRPNFLERKVSFVLLVAVGLLIMTFNELAYRFIFGPLGFEKDSPLAPLLAFSLIALSFVTLLLDKIISRTDSRQSEQDKELWQLIDETLPWYHIDRVLDNLHSEWYLKNDFDRFRSLVNILEDERNRFVDGSLEPPLKKFRSSLIQLSKFTALNFHDVYDHSPQKKLLPILSERVTGKVLPEYVEAAEKLKSLCFEFEKRYKALVASVRARGLLGPREFPEFDDEN